MVKQYDARLTELEEATLAGLQDAAERVLKLAREYAPVEDGDLRKSGRITTDWKTVELAFKAPHAWLQHEKVEWNHPKGGGAKYLQRAVDELGVSAVVDGVRARVRRGR